MKVIIDKAIPFVKGVLEPFADVEYIDGDRIGREHAARCDAMLIRTRTRCDKNLLDGSKVGFIASATIGFDHIDTQYCRSKSITTVRAEGCNARGVLQWVAAALAHMLALDGRRPEDCTLGVVGVGHIGSIVAEYARMWGFDVVCCDPPRQAREGGDFISLAELARKADIITLHTPLDATTHHMIDRRVLAAMRTDAMILNASRGEVIDTQALLHSEHRYVLDVWESEPNIDPEVLRHASLATTHIAGYSAQGKANASAAVIRKLAAHYGLPLTEWYPAEIARVQPQAIGWQQMCSTMPAHFDIEQETRRFKADPSQFEHIRNTYNYRQEYF
ncbi:MAG: 4-phosphoerythronate dehydrogenase [Alistipes sp.]|nr:4-phosphoerythronate dehydrogenase [Alistipes sp.]